MSQDSPQSPEGFPSAGISINVDSPRLSKKIRRKKTPFWRSPLMIVMLLLLGASGGVFYLWQQQQAAQGMKLLSIDNKSVDELSTLSFKLPFSSDAVKPTAMQMTLVRAPEGAAIDPETAIFTWTPAERDGPGEFDLVIEARPHVSPDQVSRQQFRITVNEVNTPPTIEYIDPMIARSDMTLKIPLNVIDSDLPHPKICYELIGDIPEGAHVDSMLGIFEWQPSDDLANQAFEFEVKASETDAPEVSATRKFQVTVKLYDPIEKLKNDFADRGINAEHITLKPNAGGFAGTGRVLRVGEDRLDIFTYDSKAAADKETDFVAPDLKQLFGKKDPFTVPTKIYRSDRMFVVAAGVSDELHYQLSFMLGTAVASTNDFTPTTVAGANNPSAFNRPPDKPMPVEPDASVDPVGDSKLETLYVNKDLFNKRNYNEIRHIFAERFARTHADAISAAFGADLENMTAWLDEHQDLKEDLYTAIDPQYDNPLEALRVFHELWKTFPDKIEEYGSLAIATSVVWDSRKRGVYDYSRHQQRTHSIMPDNLLDSPAANFEYLVQNEKVMEGRAQLVPWEFMVHLVNHETPGEERAWALYTYLSKRQMFGKCYAEVPYDDLMLATQSEQCLLDGKQYTLPNLKEFGGVCAMQADFAARVGKSIGVPAEYVRGPSSYGEHHAWVMWVELKNLTKTGINFSLESHGRYRGDKFYVGELQDPQTGTWITDRELELRLHTVGLDSIAKRQADFIMAAYPYLKSKRKFSIDEQVEFLDTVIKLSPGNEAAWQSLAGIAGEGDLDRKHERQMRKTLDLLFVTFSNFPDFTWKIFDNLIQYEEEIKNQIKLYDRLIQLYVSAGRPDLASEARLMMTGYLIDDKRELEAVEGLAATIVAFPDEGRYVPKMLDRLEVIVNQNPQYQRHLISFYSSYLPKVPQRRGDRASPFCIKMYERGIMRFEQAGANNEANKYKGLLAQLKSGVISN